MSSVERTGDMDLKSKLVLWRQEDGDIVVKVIEMNGHFYTAEVEFCAPGLGGGRSPLTHEALNKLFEAMHRENEIQSSSNK